jgi:hypothetical protein
MFGVELTSLQTPYRDRATAPGLETSAADLEEEYRDSFAGKKPSPRYRTYRGLHAKEAHRRAGGLQGRGLLRAATLGAARLATPRVAAVPSGLIAPV